LPPCPMIAKPCPGVSPRPRRLQAPVPAFTIFAEMTLGGSENLRSTEDAASAPDGSFAP
ncbi:hypothetical protein T11_3580, partial [Trichinella zimbabwensis]